MFPPPHTMMRNDAQEKNSQNFHQKLQWKILLVKFGWGTLSFITAINEPPQLRGSGKSPDNGSDRRQYCQSVTSIAKLGRITFPTIEGDIYYPKIEAQS